MREDQQRRTTAAAEALFGGVRLALRRALLPLVVAETPFITQLQVRPQRAAAEGGTEAANGRAFGQRFRPVAYGSDVDATSAPTPMSPFTTQLQGALHRQRQSREGAKGERAGRRWVCILSV